MYKIYTDYQFPKDEITNGLTETTTTTNVHRLSGSALLVDARLRGEKEAGTGKRRPTSSITVVYVGGNTGGGLSI